jgi:hypothetical protein
MRPSLCCPTGAVLWRGAQAGQVAGGDWFAPKIRLLGELGPVAARERAQRRLEAWLAAEAGRGAATPATAQDRRRDRRAEGSCRAGWRSACWKPAAILDRRDVERDLSALSQVERRTLKTFGIRGGSALRLDARLAEGSPASGGASPSWRASRSAPLQPPPDPAARSRPLALAFCQAFGVRAAGRWAVPVETLEALGEARAKGKGTVPDTDLTTLGLTREQSQALFAALKSTPRDSRRTRERGPARQIKDSPFAALSALTAKPAPNRRRRRRPRSGGAMSPFHQVLANNAVANIVNYTVWFALTFWVFLETRSVFATGMIAGVFLVLTAAFAIWFGSLVDHHRKKRVMLGSSLASLTFYAVSLAVLLVTPASQFRDVSGPMLWVLIGVVMLGVIAGNIRSIALPTLVTALVPEDRRDKANGLVGMVTGIGFLTTSVISGLLVAWTGMTGTLVFALGLTLAVGLHLWLMKLDEPTPVHDDGEKRRAKIDLPGTLKVIGAVPGLFALILFATFNNFLGGVFMALLDAYALVPDVGADMGGDAGGRFDGLHPVGTGGVSRYGLGRNPLRTLMLVNLVAWISAALFTVQAVDLASGHRLFRLVLHQPRGRGR